MFCLLKSFNKKLNNHFNDVIEKVFIFFVKTQQGELCSQYFLKWDYTKKKMLFVII